MVGPFELRFWSRQTSLSTESAICRLDRMWPRARSRHFALTASSLGRSSKLRVQCAPDTIYRLYAAPGMPVAQNAAVLSDFEPEERGVKPTTELQEPSYTYPQEPNNDN